MWSLDVWVVAEVCVLIGDCADRSILYRYGYGSSCGVFSVFGLQTRLALWLYAMGQAESVFMITVLGFEEDVDYEATPIKSPD